MVLEHVYIKIHVDSESSFDFANLYVNGSQQTQLSGPNHISILALVHIKDMRYKKMVK